MSEDVVTRFIDSLLSAFDGDETVADKAVESENVRRLQEFYRALARGDLAAAVSVMAPDVELEIRAPSELGFVCSGRGAAQILAAMKENFAKVEDQQPELVAVVAQGNEVVVIARETGRHRASGKAYDLRWAHHYQFRDGQIARLLELVAG
jgi:uncharacterized protein